MVHPFFFASVALSLLPPIPISPLSWSVVVWRPFLVCFFHHYHEFVLLRQHFFLLFFQALEELFLRCCHRRRVLSCIVEFRIDAVGVIDHGLLVGGVHLVGGDVGGRFG